MMREGGGGNTKELRRKELLRKELIKPAPQISSSSFPTLKLRLSMKMHESTTTALSTNSAMELYHIARHFTPPMSYYMPGSSSLIWQANLLFSNFSALTMSTCI